MSNTTYSVSQLVEQRDYAKRLISDLERTRAVISTHSGYVHKRSFIGGDRYEPLDNLVVSEIVSFIDEKISKNNRWLESLEEDIAEIDKATGRAVDHHE